VRIRPLARRIARTAPALYPFARWGWHRLRRVLDATDYWDDRKHFHYYREVIALARQHAPAGRHVVDVGAGPTGVLAALTWFDRRVALDRSPVPRRRGIERVCADFLAWEPDVHFDLVLCLQVLEHLAEPATFARKLLATGSTVIVSVPYRWPRGYYPPHVQDPVDEDALQAWTGRTPVETRIVTDDLQRLIAVYRSERTG
jgi:hypothetical protein